MEKYDLAKLPVKSGKQPGANPHTITFEYGKKKASLVGQVPPKLDPKNPTATVESRFAGIWEGIVGLLMPKPVPKEKEGEGVDATLPDPPDDFTGTAPVANGSLVALKDGRLMMVGSGIRVSYSKDGGRTWTSSQHVVVKVKPLSGDGDPTSLIRLKSGNLALLYGRDAKAVGAPPGHDLFFRTSNDDGETWSEEKQINVPGVTASPYHDVLTQLDNGRLVLPVRWLISGRFPEMKNAGAFGTFQGKLFHVEGHAHWPEMDTTFVYFSDDEGKNWKASKTEVVIWHKEGLGGMWPCDEPGVAQMKDKSFLMFMRTTLGRIYATTSKDGGENWHMPQPTDQAIS